MSRARAFSDSDTCIFEDSLTANLGLSPILQLQNIFDATTDRKTFSRILIRFGLSSLTAGIKSTKLYPDPSTDTTVSAYMHVFNAVHGDNQAKSFDINIHPLTQDWDEGNGLDLDNLTETGYASAVSAQSTVAWTTTGGTYEVDSNSATMHFNHGEEDLKVNITPLFKEWLAGNTANYGVILKMTDTQELKTGSTSATSINYKKFYSKETNTRKRPYIELEWDGSIKDDRKAVEFNTTADLYFYNIQRGQVKDLDGISAFPGNITISGKSSSATGSTSAYTSIQSGLTAERKEKGIYRCNVELPLTANVYDTFKDNWFVSASPTANFLFDFTTTNPASGFDNYESSRYSVSLKNLRKEYEKGTISRVRMFIKDHSLVLIPLTAATTAVSNFTVYDGTYSIREKETDEVEQSEVPISYDVNGNFFNIDTNNLYTNVLYKVVLKLNMKGEVNYYDEEDVWCFKVI